MLSVVPLIACSHAPATDSSRVDPGGYGPYRLGMTFNAVNALLGKPAAPITTTPDPGACDSIWRNGDYEHPDVRFLFFGDSLELIDIWLADTVTRENVGVGSTAQAITKAYQGRIRVDVDHYDSGTFHIFATNENASSVYRFSYSADEVITQMRVATPSSVSLVEGCG